MRSRATDGQSHDQLKYLPTAANVQQVQPAKQVSPKQPRRGVVPPSPGRQDAASSDSSPSQQPYPRRTSETLTHLQSDPQVPALIKEIDDLMGGLLDSPIPEPKQSHEVLPRPINATTVTEPARAPVEVVASRSQERENMEERPGEEEVDDDDGDIVFPKNFNPADFVRDEEIKIDPRNFLNTPSPEPNLLELKGALSTGPTSGGQPRSQLVGGMLSTVR